MTRPRRPALALATIALLCLAAVGPARAGAAAAPEPSGKTPAQRLIDAYSPRLVIREQEDPPCETTAEQYEATTVGSVLGNPAVTLTRLGPKGEEILVKRAPTAADIAGLGERFHLNLPGDPLGNTCVYARDFAKLKREGKAPAATYAHIAREAGHPGFVLQYWFFWYFNQFNDLHEGDWEGMQITFPEASGPRQALEEGPDEIALFQHAGGEKADWESGKVEKEGTHPVVYPAAGSHATFYASAVYIQNGRKGSGVGCDNTTSPHRKIAVRPIQVPTRPGPNSPFRWLNYEGRWGQKEQSFNNGPTGPSTKRSWVEPFAWMEGIRTTSPTLPVGSVLGPTVTKAFCGTVADVTSFLNASQRTPWILWAFPAAVLLLVALIAWRTRWRPVELELLRAPRAFGQIVVTGMRLYWRHWRAFVPIGLSAILIVGGLRALSWLLTGGDTGRGLDSKTGVSGLHVAAGEILAGVGLPVASAVVAAAAIVAVGQVAEGGTTSFTAAYRDMWRRFRRVVGAQLLAMLMLLAMALTVVGIPFAAWKYVGWLFVQQQILFEDRTVRESFRGSSRVVRGRWWYTLRVAAFFWLVSTIAGPILGFVLIFTYLPLLLINAIGTVVFALFIPYVTIGQTLLYYDLEAQGEKAPARWRRRLPRLRRRAATAGAGAGARAPPGGGPRRAPPRPRRRRRRRRLTVSLGGEDPRLQRSAPRPRPGRRVGHDGDRGRCGDRGGRLRLRARGPRGGDRRAGGDRDADRARPRQQRDRRGAARGGRGLERRHGAARRGSDARGGRVLRARRRRPDHPLGVELRPRRGDGGGEAGRMPRRSDPRPPLAAAGALRHRRRRRALRQRGAAAGDRTEASAARRLRPHPRVLGLREPDRRDAAAQSRPQGRLDRALAWSRGDPPRRLRPQVRREDELRRLLGQRRQRLRPAHVEALGDQHRDAACHRLLDDLRQPLALRAQGPAGQQPLAEVGEHAVVARVAVAAGGQRLVGQQPRRGRVGGGELQRRPNPGGDLHRPLLLGRAGRLDPHLKPREGRLEGVGEVVWLPRGVVHSPYPCSAGGQI
jgi:hypothetical protein